MSLYICEICDNLRDSDYTEIVEVEYGFACLSCWQDRQNDLEQEAFEKRRYGGEVYEQD